MARRRYWLVIVASSAGKGEHKKGSFDSGGVSDVLDAMPRVPRAQMSERNVSMPRGGGNAVELVPSNNGMRSLPVSRKHPSASTYPCPGFTALHLPARFSRCRQRARRRFSSMSRSAAARGGGRVPLVCVTRLPSPCPAGASLGCTRKTGRLRTIEVFISLPPIPRRHRGRIGHLWPGSRMPIGWLRSQMGKVEAGAWSARRISR